MPLTAFLSGLVEPSRTAAATTLISAVLFLLGICALVTPQSLARVDGGYLADTPKDDYGWLTVSALGLREADSDVEQILILGGSAVRQIVIEPRIAGKLERRDEPLRVVNLASARQTLWEAAAILEQVSEDQRGTVVIGVGPSLFTRTNADLVELRRAPRIALPSVVLDAAFAAAGLAPTDRTGIYVIDHGRYFRSRVAPMVSGLIRGPHERQQYRWVGLPPLNPEGFAKIGESVLARMQTYTQGADLAEDLLRKLVGQVRSRPGMDVLFMEHGINPAFIEDYLGEDFYRRHLLRTERLAEALDVAYINPARDVGVGPEDFYDWCHLRREAAVLAVADKLAEDLRHWSETRREASRGRMVGSDDLG